MKSMLLLAVSLGTMRAAAIAVVVKCKQSRKV